MKGLNENEINDFVEWTKHQPVHVALLSSCLLPVTGGQAIKYLPCSKCWK